MFMSEINSTDHNSIVSRHFPDEDFRMTEFFFPILEHFCPLFIQIAQMGLILPLWGLILPRSPPPTPVHYSAVTHPFLGYVRTQNNPKPIPKHPFSLKVGKMNYCPGNLDPN